MSWRLNDGTVVRAGYGGGTIPFPDNRYAFNYPVKQNYSGTVPNGFAAAGSMAAGFPSPTLVNIPQDGIIPVSGSLLNSTYDVIPPKACGRARCTPGTSRSSGSSPSHLTADLTYVGNRGVNLVMDVDENASLVYGSGNVGRPQNAAYNRTGTSAASAATRTSRSTTAAGQGRPPFRERPAHHQLVHVSANRKTYVNENTSIGTPIDFELSWARSNFDRTHNYVLSIDLRVALGSRQALDGREHARQDRRRLAAEWPLVAQSGTPLNITGNGTLLNTPGNTAFADLNGSNTVLGGLGPGKLYFDPVRVHAPRGGRAGQHEAEQRP